MKLEIKNLSFAYRDHPVLQDINFDTRPGELLSVLGLNGVGKSTLFRCILGILRDYQGEILLDGREARGIAQREMASMIAYIPQSHRPTFGYTVQDTVLMGVTHRLSPFAAPRAEHVRQAREAMAAHKESKLWALAENEEANVNGKVILAAYDAGDETAVQVVNTYVHYLCVGVTSIINIFQPEVLCLGGGISRRSDVLVEPIRAFNAAHGYGRSCPKQSRIMSAELFGDAGIIGAALLGKGK